MALLSAILATISKDAPAQPLPVEVPELLRRLDVLEGRPRADVDVAVRACAAAPQVWCRMVSMCAASASGLYDPWRAMPVQQHDAHPGPKRCSTRGGRILSTLA